MLKKLMNHAVIDLTITPVDPLLIKSGQATVSGVDMSFVRTYKFGEKPEPFIPGSSLKGVIRSYAEKICRTLRDDPVPVCLPYVEPEKEQNGEINQAACGNRIKHFLKKSSIDSIPSSDIYRLSCPTCRTFGSHYFIGRLATSDGYLTDDFKKTDRALLETRDGVAIDRLTGGPVGGAKYDLEVLTKGEFGTRIEIQNFERWQLGLLGLVLRDMRQELIRIGMGKSRGLGRIKAEITRFEITYFGKPQKTLTGLASGCSDKECMDYGLFRETETGAILQGPASAGLRHGYDLTGTWESALEPAVKDLTAYIADVPWPKDIDAYTKRRQ